jgi:transcriptional regulator with XRE-family HTH domain
MTCAQSTMMRSDVRYSRPREPGPTSNLRDNNPLHFETQVFDNSNMSTQGQRLKEVRIERGLSKADLQRACGLKSSSTLTELENDLHPKSPHLPRIAEELGVNTVWLTEGRGPKYPGKGIVNLVEKPDPNKVLESDVELADNLALVIRAFARATPFGRKQILRAAANAEKAAASGQQSLAIDHVAPKQEKSDNFVTWVVDSTNFAPPDAKAYYFDVPHCGFKETKNTWNYGNTFKKFVDALAQSERTAKEKGLDTSKPSGNSNKVEPKSRRRHQT